MINQKGILISDAANNIKAKIVYSGDVSIQTMDNYKTMFENKYPTCTVTIYETDEDANFLNAVVNSPLTEE